MKNFINTCFEDWKISFFIGLAFIWIAGFMDVWNHNEYKWCAIFTSGIFLLIAVIIASNNSDSTNGSSGWD